MPKSKRNKIISLTRTEKKVHERKDNLTKALQECVEHFDSIYIFDYGNMRPTKLKDVRTEWRDSRIFMGKNKVMQCALGRTAEDEQRPNLSQLSGRLGSTSGLLFTNRTRDEVKSYFAALHEEEYAVAGNVLAQTISVAKGPVPIKMPTSMFDSLRKLNLPVEIKNGEIILTKEHAMNLGGQPLTVEQAKALKLFEMKTGIFTAKLSAVWTKQDEEVVDDP